MENEIAQWKPEDAIKSVRDKIRAEFVNLIPPDVFTKWVEAEIKAFTADKPTSSGYGYRSEERRPSDFASVVISVLTEETKTEIKKLLESPDWREQWNGKGQEPSKRVKEILAEHGPEIINTVLQNLLANSIQLSVNSMLSNMRS